MSSIPSKTQVIAGGAIILGILACVCVLAWHGTLTGTEAYGILVSIVTLAGTALVGSVAVNAGAKAARSTSTTVVHTTEPPLAPAEPTA